MTDTIATAIKHLNDLIDAIYELVTNRVQCDPIFADGSTRATAHMSMEGIVMGPVGLLNAAPRKTILRSSVSKARSIH